MAKFALRYIDIWQQDPFDYMSKHYMEFETRMYDQTEGKDAYLSHNPTVQTNTPISKYDDTHLQNYRSKVDLHERTNRLDKHDRLDPVGKNGRFDVLNNNLDTKSRDRDREGKKSKITQMGTVGHFPISASKKNVFESKSDHGSPRRNMLDNGEAESDNYQDMVDLKDYNQYKDKRNKENHKEYKSTETLNSNDRQRFNKPSRNSVNYEHNNLSLGNNEGNLQMHTNTLYPPKSPDAQLESHKANHSKMRDTESSINRENNRDSYNRRTTDKDKDKDKDNNINSNNMHLDLRSVNKADHLYSINNNKGSGIESKESYERNPYKVDDRLVNSYTDRDHRSRDRDQEEAQTQVSRSRRFIANDTNPNALDQPKHDHANSSVKIVRDVTMLKKMNNVQDDAEFNRPLDRHAIDKMVEQDLYDKYKLKKLDFSNELQEPKSTDVTTTLKNRMSNNSNFANVNNKESKENTHSHSVPNKYDNYYKQDERKVSDKIPKTSFEDPNAIYHKAPKPEYTNNKVNYNYNEYASTTDNNQKGQPNNYLDNFNKELYNKKDSASLTNSNRSKKPIQEDYNMNYNVIIKEDDSFDNKHDKAYGGAYY